MSIVRKGMGGIFAGPLPDLVSLLAAPALAAAATAAVAWLQGRSGRKVRLKVGDTEAEARTVGELREMLSMAQDLKKKSSEKEP
jgi:L-alanine-DL-glutamate epimerase-like enolase superfamily enzyme